MNDTFSNNQNNQNDEQIVRLLKRIAETTQANPYFLDELEQKLRNIHKPKRNWFTFTLRRLSPTVGWVGLLLLLGFVLNWTIRSLIPVSQPTSISPLGGAVSTPSPAAESVLATSVPEDAGYDWRGTTLFLSAQLPASPAEANVYLWTLSQPVTLDEARILAERLGINGEPGETPGEFVGNFDYTVTDGQQRLHLRADHYFTYHSAFDTMTLTKPSTEKARTIIDGFLKQHGFDFEYRLESAPDMIGQHYYVLPLTPDGREMRFDYMLPIQYDITLDETGENIIFSGYWMDYETLGTFEIITVEDALQKLLNPNPQTGMMEIFRGQGGGGGGGSFLQLNLSGTPVPFPSPTATPKVNMEVGDYTVQAGDTLGLISQKFGVSVAELIEVNQLSELGIIHIGQKLIIPKQQGQEIEDSHEGQKMEDLHGFLDIFVHPSPNGLQRKEYRLTSSLPDGTFFSYLLSGSQLNQLESYNALPITVSGLMQTIDNTPTIFVDDYTIPYPDLQFQIVRGTQSRQEVNGQPGVIVFTTEDGRSFVEVMASTNIPTDAIVGHPGDLIEQEVLIVPDETLGNMPVIHIYQSRIVSESAGNLQIQANQIQEIQVLEEIPNTAGFLPPTATLETVDLVYYVRYPPYAIRDANADIQYLQPVWRFYGHYSNGDEFEILVQALKQEFLLPELAPYTPPG